MRRLIAYISLAITILISVAVAFTPAMSLMSPGREFTSGNEIVYHLSQIEDSDYDLDSDKNAAKDVASEMSKRLESYGVEDYSVKVEGTDSVRVNVSIKSDTELNYISKYLSFSGKDFSLSGKEEETRLTADKIFVDMEARIEHVQDIIPYVVIPVSDPAEVKKLIETVQKEEKEEGGSDAESKILKAAGDAGEEEPTNEPDIFLWANWVEGDSYELAQKDQAITGQKIIASFSSKNIWYENSKEKETELQFLCGFADDAGQYDTNKLEEANAMAKYMVHMLNASKYNYAVENLFVSQSASGVTSNQIRSDASAENLLLFGSDVNLAWSATLVATLLATVIVSLILVVLFRISAPGIISTSVGSVFLTFVLFNLFKATFNIAAIVGGVVLSIMPLALGILYCNKFKEEVYKGRAMKKAHQEAMKKINLPSIDFAVVGAFAGLMLYFIAGNALKPMGIVLFFGSIISLLMIQIVFRILMSLLSATTGLQNKYSAFNIDEKLVPNLMKEEKSSYVAPYEKVDFTSKKKVIGIVTGLLAIASVAVISVFGVLKGTPLNIANLNDESTMVYTSIRSDNPTLSTEDAFKKDVLGDIYVNGEKLTFEDVKLVNRETYNYETEVTTKYTYFVTSIDGTFKESDKYSVGSGESAEDFDTLSDAIASKVNTIEGESSTEYVQVEEKVSYETVKTPNQAYIAIATAVAIAGASLYLAFRYRPSRGISALVISSASTLITYGIFAMTRIHVTAITSIVMPIAAVISLFGVILLLEKEKEQFKEHKGELPFEERKQVMVKGTALAASSIFMVMIVASYLAINFFGFGHKNFAAIFAGMLLSVVLSTLLITTLSGPISELFAKLFKNVRLPDFKKFKKARKQKIKLQNQAKPKSSEPEETIFIGIND